MAPKPPNKPPARPPGRPPRDEHTADNDSRYQFAEDEFADQTWFHRAKRAGVKYAKTFSERSGLKVVPEFNIDDTGQSPAAPPSQAARPIGRDSVFSDPDPVYDDSGLDEKMQQSPAMKLAGERPAAAPPPAMTPQQKQQRDQKRKERTNSGVKAVPRSPSGQFRAAPPTYVPGAYRAEMHLPLEDLQDMFDQEEYIQQKQQQQRAQARSGGRPGQQPQKQGGVVMRQQPRFELPEVYVERPNTFARVGKFILVLALLGFGGYKFSKFLSTTSLAGALRKIDTEKDKGK